ncbi:MAG TPA: response regulator [Pyrinomonadaceae bacterium]|nr:response regulator [Pyrinomonadaceae bacterium]
MSKRKLLLADDSITIQKVVNLTFADEGIDVITVGDGDAAMAKISESAPDVILADVHMPGLSGYQVCEMVKSNEATRELPVVLLVGSFEPFDENEAARVGANAFLTKPFQSIRQLVSQVSDLLQASAPAVEPVNEVPAEATMDHGSPVETTDEYAAPPDATSEYAAPPDAPAEYAAPPDATTEYAAPPDATTEYAAEPTPEFGSPTDDVQPTVPKVRDTTDIDSLYAQSVGGEPSHDQGTGAPRYVDAGMDDEMIETVHAEAEEPEELATEDFYQEPTAEYRQPTDDFQVQAGAYDQPVAEYQDPVDDYSGHQDAVAEYEHPVDDYSGLTPTASYDQPASAGEEPIAEFAEPVDEYREPEAAYQEPASQFVEPSPHQDEAPRSASPFDSHAEDTPTFESNPIPLDQFASTQNIDAPTTKEFSLDDSDLLELPPIDSGQTIEIRTAPGPEGGKQVVSLSPELMDALVEKVVKQLSKKE